MRLNARTRRLLLAAALLLFAWPPLAWLAARSLVVRDEPVHADALVVLSGATEYRERALRAARLFREGRAPLVVLTDEGVRGGWSQTEQRNPLFSELAREELLRAGVPAENILLLPERVDSTRSEALLLARHAPARGWRTLVVVTSPYHTRRARWTFRRALGGSGVRVGVDAPHAEMSDSPRPATWWLSARGWRNVGMEYPKLVYYWLSYR